ncbi:MAG: MgtC/SapB family protein [Halobacteriota archaeon]
MVVEIPDLLVQVAIALATGALIGLERERTPERKFAGLRTLALLCGGGPIAVEIARIETQPVLVASYLALVVGIALAIAAIRFVLRGEEVGFTTSVTVFLVGLLGLLIGHGRYTESAAIAVATVLLLSERDRLHGYVDTLTDRELRDSLKLGALVFVLYPILPDEAIDPYGVLVLREVLVFAIFVLLIEFSSYLLMGKLGGSKGLALTGLLAGGANSFAAAGVLARLADRSREALSTAAFALMLATLAMIVRNVGIAAVLAVGLVGTLWQPALVLSGLTAVAALLLWKNSETVDEFGIDVDSPFSFRSAAKFSIAYVAILLVSVGAEELFGGAGLLATAFAGGLVSSAAVSVTAATVFNGGAVAAEAAVAMVVLGIVASLTSKIVLVEWINGEMRREAVVPMAAVGVAGLGTVAVLLTAV